MSPPRPAPRTRLGIVVRVAAGLGALGLLALAARGAELGRVLDLVRSIGPAAGLALLPFLGGILLQATATRSLFGVGGLRVGFSGLVSSLLSMEAILRTVPAGPAVADAAAPALFRARAGAPIPDAIAVVAAKKCLIVLANGVYVALAVAVGFAPLRAVSRGVFGGSGLEYGAALSAVVLLVSSFALAKALVSGDVAGRLHRLLGRIPLRRARAWLLAREGSFVETDKKLGVVLAAHPARLAPAAVELVVVWVLEAVETLVILRLLHVELTWSEVLALEVVASSLRSLAFLIPSGLGVQDAGYVAVLAALGVPDAPTVGVAFVLIKRAKELVWVAFGYALFLVHRDRWAVSRAPSPAAEDGRSEPIPLQRREAGGSA